MHRPVRRPHSGRRLTVRLLYFLLRILQATLSPVEARKISICVVDVSRPDA